MSTDEANDFDYEQYSETNAPDPAKLRRGQSARRARRAAAKQRITIRIDSDVVERFKAMAPDGRGYQALINRALRDWLNAQGVKDLLRHELKELLAEALPGANDESNRESAGHAPQATGTEQADGV